MDSIAFYEARRQSLSRYAVRVWLAGMLVLLPVELAKLPLNVDLADCWVLMGLPIIWLSFLRGRRIIGLYYAIPMWVILLASLASTLAAPEPVLSLVVVGKELFLFVFFVTLAALLSDLDAGDLRLVLSIWAVVVVLHGCLIVAQFLSPGVWRTVSALAGRSTSHIYYRPTGLFSNANKAALFQLMGFVPLMLVRASRRLTLALGVALLLTMAATGSMAAIIAFATGLAVALAAVTLHGRLVEVARMLLHLVLVVALLAGLLYLVLRQNERFQEHLARILLGRTERSSESRFDLWQRGFQVFLDHGAFLWGVGPENFRIVDGQGNQLHNDLLAFTVERGLLGVLGLVLLALLAVSRAVRLVRISAPSGQIHLVVFVAALAAVLVESLTHQTFRFHELWLVLAVQEAMLLKLTTVPEPATPGPRAETPALSPSMVGSQRYAESGGYHAD